MTIYRSCCTQPLSRPCNARLVKRPEKDEGNGVEDGPKKPPARRRGALFQHLMESGDTGERGAAPRMETRERACDGSSQYVRISNHTAGGVGSMLCGNRPSDGGGREDVACGCAQIDSSVRVWSDTLGQIT
jgi:hypothetical protein